MHNYIALAVPFFFVLIGIELAVARRRGRRVYRFADAITDLSCGVTQQVTLLFYAAFQVGVYAWVYRRARIVTWDHALVPWLLAFVAVDYAYYWWHRLSHEVNFLWAAHVVHHQSEDYNLAVALRQAVLTSWTALPFYLPLAFLGIPPIVFVTIHSFSTLYQFWIHTELVGTVGGPLGRILNLPHHHRVHHAINPQYLDKNYGATLIVWDRLFGTFAEEEEPPVFGITKPLRSFNPLWAQVHYWVEMAQMARRGVGLDKVRAWVESPAWKPGGKAAPPRAVSPSTFEKFDVPMSRKLSLYVGVQFALVIVATFVLMTWQDALGPVGLTLSVAAVIGALVALGGLIEGKPWAKAAEGARWALTGLAAVFVVLG